MLSEKALERLIESIKALNNGRLSFFQQLYVNRIEKDLEVLECFKKLFEKDYLDGRIKFDFDTTNPYIIKIKEWLNS